jgi:hypothetical protein
MRQATPAQSMRRRCRTSARKLLCRSYLCLLLSQQCSDAFLGQPVSGSRSAVVAQTDSRLGRSANHALRSYKHGSKLHSEHTTVSMMAAVAPGERKEFMPERAEDRFHVHFGAGRLGLGKGLKHPVFECWLQCTEFGACVQVLSRRSLHCTLHTYSST